MKPKYPNIHRRKLLKQGTLLSLSLVFARYAKGGKVMKDTGIWEEITDGARWCPSVHNLQPHKLKIISATEAVLHYDTARLLPFGDPKSIFATVAMGIFIEHLSIAAAPHGLMVNAAILNSISVSQKGIVPFAQLKLLPRSTQETLSPELIKKRKTSRGHYDGKPVDEATLIQIKEEAKRHGYGFGSSADKDLVDFVVNLNQRTLFEDISDDDDRQELDKLFRYTQQEAEGHRDGLWAKCMGFPGTIMKTVFRQPERWQEEPLRTVLNAYYHASFKGTATIGWFNGEFNNTRDWLAAGRMLARNWLLITRQGYYIHPFGSLITNTGAYPKIQNRLAKPGDRGQIWMIFRVGRSKEPVRSYRLDLKDILI